MADAHGSGPCVRKDVRVQLPPRPPGDACSRVAFAVGGHRCCSGGPSPPGPQPGASPPDPLPCGPFGTSVRPVVSGRPSGCPPALRLSVGPPALWLSVGRPGCPSFVRLSVGPPVVGASSGCSVGFRVSCRWSSMGSRTPRNNLRSSSAARRTVGTTPHAASSIRPRRVGSGLRLRGACIRAVGLVRLGHSLRFGSQQDHAQCGLPVHPACGGMTRCVRG